jgi:hypothetical protein
MFANTVFSLESDHLMYVVDHIPLTLWSVADLAHHLSSLGLMSGAWQRD